MSRGRLSGSDGEASPRAAPPRRGHLAQPPPPGAVTPRGRLRRPDRRHRAAGAPRSAGTAGRAATVAPAAPAQPTLEPHTRPGEIFTGH